MALRVSVITLVILLPYVCSFMENLFATHTADKIYKRILRNEHHQENYKNSLLSDITPYGLQLKKHAQIETISEDFPKKWSNVLHDAERKLIKLLLDEKKLIQQQLENKFDNELITNFPENHTDIKNEIINRNFTLKITLNERR